MRIESVGGVGGWAWLGIARIEGNHIGVEFCMQEVVAFLSRSACAFLGATESCGCQTASNPCVLRKPEDSLSKKTYHTSSSKRGNSTSGASRHEGGFGVTRSFGAVQKAIWFFLPFFVTRPVIIQHWEHRIGFPIPLDERSLY